MMEENYRIHGGLASKSADNILWSAAEEEESGDSCKSIDYHPNRRRRYSVSIFNNYNESSTTSENSALVNELKEFRDRSIELSKHDVNQMSDIRLLSLDCIYLFSKDIKFSVSKYLGIYEHNTLLSSLFNERLSNLDPVVFSWCLKLSNLNFTDGNNKWMELQAATIEILCEAIKTKDKEIVQAANMLQTIAPRLYISSNELNIEDTFVHSLFSYAIGLIFGIEDLLMHQPANGRLSKQHEADQSQFKPDYIAFVKIRCERRDVTIAEVKPTGASSGRPPSDLVKLGQQMKVMVSNLMTLRVDNPTVCGILVKVGKDFFQYN